MRDIAQLFELKRLLMTTDSASLKSSEGTCSSIGDEREKAKIVQKLVEIKDKLRALNEKQEADVEKFLSVTRASEISKGVGADNPQRARIRNNFERQNRKHAQETENLQKKLLDYEERLKLVDNGEYEPSPSRARVFPTGIRKAKGVGETMINAQMELAQRVKSAFSADNVNSQNGVGGGKTAQSTFFTARRSADAEDVESSDRKSRNVRGSSTLPPNLALSSPDPLNTYKEEDFEQLSRPGSASDTTNNPYHTADNSLYLTSQNVHPGTNPQPAHNPGFEAIHENLNTILHHLVLIDRKYDRLEDEVKKDIRFYAEALEEERFKTTKLEALLNEAMEMQTAEIVNLKNESTMASRLDMRHDDRFRNVEENIESLQNHLIRIDNNLMDVRQAKLTSNIWQRVALTGGNIVVEFLKISLFVVASLLDLVRPLTGSRNRSAMAFGLVFLAIFFGHHLSKIPLPFGSSSSPSNAAIEGPPK